MKLLAIALIAATAPAYAGGVTSAYSDFDIKKCKVVESDPQSESGIWECKGLRGWPVTYLEGDLRGNAAFGASPLAQCTSAQSFAAFNSPGPRIEWRLDKGKPFATILRWTTDKGDGTPKQTWLVVTKLDGKHTCRTAVVAGATPKANDVARNRADATRGFDCEKGAAEVIATTPLKAEELMSGVPCGPGPFKED